MKKWFFAFFIWLLVVEASAAVRQRTPEVPVRSTRSFRQQVDSYAEMLGKEIATAKTTKEKYRSLRLVLGRIQELRDNNTGLTAQDEAHTDLLISVLEAIPSEGKFKKKDCSSYEVDFLNQFEPAAEEGPQEPAVKAGWGLLQSLCK